MICPLVFKKNAFSNDGVDMTRQRITSMLFGAIALVWCNSFAVEEGKLTVTTDPEGVEVWLGENYIGNSPVIEKKVPTGRYTVKLVDPVQRISLVEQVMITINNTVVIEKKLKPKFGTLKVTSVPEDADVFMTMPLGKTPLINEFINPGKYIIEIRHPDKQFHSVQKNVVVSEGMANVVTDTLFKDKVSNTNTILRLGLGAGALAGFIWAAFESGNRQTYRADERYSDAGKAGTRLALGVVAGSLCVIGFEIVAFF